MCNTSRSLRGNRSNLNRLKPNSPDNSASLPVFVKTKKSAFAGFYLKVVELGGYNYPSLHGFPGKKADCFTTFAMDSNYVRHVAEGVGLPGRKPTPSVTCKSNTNRSLRGNRSNLNRLKPNSPDNSASFLAFVKTKKSACADFHINFGGAGGSSLLSHANSFFISMTKPG
jgi:hypothetical protein